MFVGGERNCLQRCVWIQIYTASDSLFTVYIYTFLNKCTGGDQCLPTLGESVSSPYKSCDNFVEFFLKVVCIKSRTFVVFRIHKWLLGFCDSEPHKAPGLLWFG